MLIAKLSIFLITFDIINLISILIKYIITIIVICLILLFIYFFLKKENKLKALLIVKNIFKSLIMKINNFL